MSTAADQPWVRPGNESHQPLGSDPTGEEGEGAWVRHGYRARSATTQGVCLAGEPTAVQLCKQQDLKSVDYLIFSFCHSFLPFVFWSRWPCAASPQREWDQVRRWPRGTQQRKCWKSWDIKCLSLSFPNQLLKQMKKYCSVIIKKAK